jgi:hypothetical protein
MAEAGEPLLTSSPAPEPSPAPSAEKSCMGTVISVLAPLFMLCAVIVQVVLSNSQPYLAAYLALAMSVLGLLIDLANYRRGRTAFFPKVLDTSLFILWTANLLALLLSPPSSPTLKFVLIFGGVVNTLFLSLISFMSTFIKRPWTFQLAADKVPDESLWKKSPNQSPEADAKQAGFLAVCGSVTNFWGAIFFLMAIGNFLNCYYNTDITDDFKSLTHDDSTMNVLLGIVWGIVWTLIGRRGTPVIVERAKNRLIEKAKAKGWKPSDDSPA